MPVIATHILTAGSGTDASSYATASISPTIGKIVILAVGNMKAAGATIPTVSGASTTWTQIATREESSFTRVTLFRGVAAGTGALTIDFGGNTQLRCGWSINEITNVDTGGTNGANAIVQSVGNSSTATGSLTVTLAAFGSTDNATFGAVVINATSPVVTHGTGFTELGEATAESLGIQTQFKNTNDTSVDWTQGEANQMAGIGIELKFLESVSGGSEMFLAF